MSGKTYTVIPQGGLCNRMRMLDAALALGSATGRQLEVQWQLDPGLNCRFEDLFELPQGVARIDNQDRTGPFAKLRKTIAKRINRLHYDCCLYQRELDAYVASHDDVADLGDCGSVLIAACTRFYGREPYFERLRPTADNRAAIDRLTSGFGPHMVGVHIRRTDHVHAITNSPTELFVAAMEEAIRETPDTRFFLATDCPDTEQELAERFPGRIVVHPKRSLDRGDADAIRDALIDVYGLAACQRILGSVQSSFSETAAQIGRIPLVMIESSRSSGV